MTWRGDISGVRHLAERVGDLARVPSRVAARVSDELAAEVQAEFDAGTDPYGDPWAPLSPVTEARGRTAPPLTDSGDMRDGIRVASLAGAGVGITVPHPGAPHQTGWSGKHGAGPARPILPDRGALPEAWENIIFDATEDEFQKAVKR